MNKFANSKIITSLIESLDSHDLTLVTYRTKTGTRRVMGCTRLLAAIPEEKHDGRFDRLLNREDLVCIYDYQNSGWRAFRKDSVISFSVV